MLILRKLIIPWMFLYIILSGLQQAMSDKQNTLQMQTRLAEVGFSTEITCSFDFPDRKYYVIWYKNVNHLFRHEPATSLFFSKDGCIYTINEQEDTAFLRIQNVRVEDAGRYHCKAVPIFVGKPVFQYWDINVQDGPILAPIRSVMENETFSAQCCVTFTYTTEPVKYLWSIGILLATTFRDNFGGNLSCSNVSFIAVIGFHNKLLECTIENELNSSTHERIKLILPPTMKLQINGRETNAIVPLANGTNVNITCYVENSMPKANISWNCDGKTCPSEGSLFSDMHEKLNNTSRELFTTRSTINYTATRNEDVICTAGLYGDRNWTKSVKIFVLGPSDNLLTYFVIILTGGIVITGCLLIIWKKLCSHKTTLPFVSTATSLYNRFTHVAMNLRELPSIQSNHAEPLNIGQNRHEEENQNHKNERKFLSADDVKLSFQLSREGTMTYWVATVLSGDCSSKVTKVIAKSVSENARMKELMNFRALANSVITLQKQENIVEVLGVAHDDVPYFIYQEYIETGTLKDFLMSGGSYKEGIPNYKKNLQLTTFAADVCEGMYFLAKHNYRHPVLSARKALLSSTGRCKLYDFWPADLATDVISQILTKTIPPIAWLAPETVFIGSYLEKSDVWSFGVVLWEIFTLGETPYGGLTCDEIENKLRRKEYLEQPMACAGGIFGAMLSMWSQTIDKRPSFASLQMTLQGLLNDMRKSFSCDAADDEDPRYFILNKYPEDDDYTECKM
ncbi:uncharacterized protein [Apostichopus japonicus]|uniref:uncharacterized protein n=1 Tax=Stichopus japonicus TaxID=307972 RepID=UPI003AB8B928